MLIRLGWIPQTDFTVSLLQEAFTSKTQVWNLEKRLEKVDCGSIIRHYVILGLKHNTEVGCLDSLAFLMVPEFL